MNIMNTLKNLTKKIVVGLTITATIFWSMSFSSLIPALPVSAALIVPNTIGLINGNFANAPIKASSAATAIVKLNVSSSLASQTLQAVTVTFATTTPDTFATTTLAAITDDATSGVALYNDAGATLDNFDGTDVLVATSTGWIGLTSTTTLTAQPAISIGAATSTFYVVIRTSSTAANNYQIIATIPANGVITSNGNGPTAAFSANSVRVDTSAPSITGVTGNSGSPALTVNFSEPVQKSGGGALTANQFTFIDRGTVNTHSTSTVAHTAGQAWATVTLTGNTDTGDFDDSPSTFAAATSSITDMAGNAAAPTAVAFTSPISITTFVVPTATTTGVYSTSNPLVTFAATGGNGNYTWSDVGTSLTPTNLSLSAAGVLTGTATSSMGNYQVTIRVQDNADPIASTTKNFTINVGNAGGTMPGITNITPGGAAQSATPTLTITGSNTSFSSTSTVVFLMPPGVSGTVGITTGAVTAGSATSLTVPLTIAAEATVGARDVKVTTGSQFVFMPYGFSVFASGGASGLALNLPTDAATNVSVTQGSPNFNFNPSTNAGVSSYRLTVKPNSDFSGTALWDYAFPSYAVNSTSHCGASTCNVSYGAGQFMPLITQATQLAANTTYYWNVRTYSQMPFNINDSVEPLETTVARSFTSTVSISDNAPPSIQHRQLFSAQASAALNIFARVMDNIANASTTPALTTKVQYCATASCTPTDATGSSTAISIGNGYFKYTIPSGSVGAAGAVVRYWLSATDGTNTTWFKNTGDTAFNLTTMAAGTATITGTVTDNAGTPAAIVGATVFAEGTGFNATTAADGTYTLSNLPPGMYDIVAVKTGYADRRVDGMSAGVTGINFSLPSGGGGGFGGDTTRPRLKFSGPPDNGMAPGNDSGFKIFMAFDKAMSQTAMTNSGNLTVNSMNPLTGAMTNITASGTLAYYQNAPPVGAPQENNLAIWSLNSPNTFGDNKTIVVKITASATDTANNSVQGNQPDGSYAFSFTTGSTANFTGFNSGSGTFSGGGTFGSGAFTPPYVTGSTPAPGMYDIPVNQKIVFNFSEAMADDSGSYALKTYIIPYVLSGANPPYTETAVSSGSYTVSLDTSKKVTTVTITGNMAVSTRYRVKVLGGAKASSGMTLSPPGSEANQMYMTEFKTSSSADGDTAAPSITGIYPANGATAITVNTNAVSVGFNKDMDASTMTTSNFYLSIGSTAVNGTIDYRPTEDQAYFIPKNSLNATTTYTINLSSSILALNGQALTATTSVFTTGGADTTLPTVSFINADDYSLAITFSEPMNSAKAVDTLNYASSTLNPSRYTIKQATAAVGAENGATVTLGSDVSLTYDSITNTVIIKGVSLTAGNEVYVSVYAVKDAAGNVMTTGNTAKAPVQSSSTTKGALGPMAMSSDAFSTGGGFMPTSFSAGTFGFAPPVDVKPFSMMAGKTTVYGVRLPISRTMSAPTAAASSTIVLTFPTGFDVSGAKQDINSPMRSDLNGPGSNTVKFQCAASVTNGKTCPATGGSTVTGDFTANTATQGGLADDGVVVNATARSVTIYLSAATNSEGHDFLSLDIAGIINSAVPKDFNTTGYTVDIKTKNGSTLLESLTSQPFFIQAGGSGTLSGTITATGVGATSDTMKVYLMSPMTGPTDTTSSAFNGSSQATYSFSGLAAGEYFLFTDPTVTLNSTDFTGKAMPERINATSSTVYDFTMANNSTGGTNVTIRIAGGPADEPMDIFAGSPTGFKVKQITLNSTAGDSENFTVNLADGNWMVGIGPQMPKGPMAGPPPTPSYLPPQPVNITVQSSGSPVVVESSDTANDGTLKFTLTTADKYIQGTVQDGSGKVMANAEVYAYSPQGGMGTHGQTATNGTFSLGVIDGSYIVGSFVPGMPSSKEVPVVVSSAESAYLFIDGASTGVTAAAALTSFILKIAKPDYTISGKVTDGTNVVQGASVYAYRTDAPGHSNANTDSSGNYTLYVANGTWKVGVFLPQYGNLTEQTITISGANSANQNFAPSSTGTFNAVSGNVKVGGTNRQGAFVRISGNSTSNEAITGSDGNYSFKVPQGNGYVIKLNIPGMGEASTTAAFNVTGDITGKDFAIGAANTITVLTSSSVTKAFVELMDINGVGGRAEITSATSTSLSLPNGSYKVSVNIPGVSLPLTAIAGTSDATAYATSTGVGVITVNGAESLTVTVPTLRTVAGTTSVGDAWVELINNSSGVHLGTKSASTTPYAFSLQVADSATDYIINAMKPGFYRDPSNLTVNGADPQSLTLTLTASTLNVSGRIYIGSSGAANAFVRAEKQGAGFSGAQADANGNFTIPVTAGTWKIYGVAEGYAETAYSSNPVIITTTSSSGNDITLSSTVTLSPPKSKPITPSSGGTLEDTTAGIKLTMPPNALSQDTSAGNIQTKETNNVRSTSNSKPVNNKAIEITAIDSNNNPIKRLSNSVTVEMSYTPTELTTTPSASDSSINTKTEADKLQMAYWDETTANWVTLPSTITYYKLDGAILDSSDLAHTPSADLSNVATTTISAATIHFSQYAPVSTTDGAPGTPTGLTATAQSGTQINLSWTAVAGATSYDLYRHTINSGDFPRIGSEPTTTSTSYADAGLNSGTTYYYKVSAINASGESIASGAVAGATQSSAGGTVITPAAAGTPTPASPATPAETPATPAAPASAAGKAAEQIKNIVTEAASIAGRSVESVLAAVGALKDAKAEAAAEIKYTAKLTSGLKNITAEVKSAITNFVNYGTPTTKVLGAGERAGVVNSYKSAFGKVPATEAEWSDVIKISNGRWPSVKSTTAETKATAEFKKVYKRTPNMQQANDNAAVTVISYGLRPTGRNLNSEKAAIKSFKAIYGHTPVSALAWDIVRAIAYSGAKR